MPGGTSGLRVGRVQGQVLHRHGAAPRHLEVLRRRLRQAARGGPVAGQPRARLLAAAPAARHAQRRLRALRSQAREHHAGLPTLRAGAEHAARPALPHRLWPGQAVSGRRAGESRHDGAGIRVGPCGRRPRAGAPRRRGVAGLAALPLRLRRDAVVLLGQGDDLGGQGAAAGSGEASAGGQAGAAGRRLGQVRREVLPRPAGARGVPSPLPRPAGRRPHRLRRLAGGARRKPGIRADAGIGSRL
mmetsp:Transcript_50040/g.160081  ORF Transcript_50040/g.160081 Transcript_50040/m.160081 type:complete len:244 (+) Transcript_50040:579-1310(+)